MSRVNPNDIVDIRASDLEYALNIMSAVMNHLQANDVSESYRMLEQDIRYAPLTTEVTSCYERLSGVMKDYLYQKYQDDEEEDEGE